MAEHRFQSNDRLYVLGILGVFDQGFKAIIHEALHLAMQERKRRSGERLPPNRKRRGA
jgi:hypothetical protein